MNEEYLKEDGYFRVIKIISNLEIIINGGTMDGLNEDDDINIIVPGDIITDPYEYDKKLGSLDLIKDTLKIKDITPYYSICHKVKKTVVKQGYLSQSVASLAASTMTSLTDKIVEEEVPLDIIESEITNGYPKLTEERIIIGDYARKRF
ncbi:hypothetical protein [Enterococcus faecium]|uniref:Uncharacterized protein n=1 Tax=Enterococcus faecium TaxID=1352 RepID=A0A242BMJ8_ENTFC|nr:hypothetical protein [Enterococcus faecium]OTN96262.1 hypothetical protein A5810_000597 [Enterococcus faecium]